MIEIHGLFYLYLFLVLNVVTAYILSHVGINYGNFILIVASLIYLHISIGILYLVNGILSRNI